MPDSRNVTAGKPKVGGAIFVAPVGTPLPTDVTTALNAAFKDLGYVSDSGVTNGTSLESKTIKAWGGDNVLNIQTSKDDTYKFTLIEILNEFVLKLVYGSDNVSGDLDNGLSIAINNNELDEVSIVIDTILRGGVLKRSVVPIGKVSNVGDIVYNDSDPVGYETTLTCTADSSGNTHYEYMKKVNISA